MKVVTLQNLLNLLPENAEIIFMDSEGNNLGEFKFLGNNLISGSVEVTFDQ